MTPRWQPEKPRLRPARLLVAWLVNSASVWVAAAIVPGFSLEERGAAFVVAAAVAVFNALLPPLVAALRLPGTLALGFLAVLAVDALSLVLADAVFPSFGEVGSYGDALLASLVIAAVSLVLQVILGHQRRRRLRVACDQAHGAPPGAGAVTDVPGIVFLEIDGLALPVLRRAMRDGNAPVMARWMADHDYRLAEWEPDLSSQTGASQAGILLGSNEDIPAFRWVDKQTGTLVACSSPADCAEIEARLSTGRGPAHRRRRQPRQPALGGRGRDDPDREPDRGREGREPRLPGLLRRWGQRDASARPVRLGGHPRVDRRRARRAARRAPARPPRRDLSVPARRYVRDRA